MTGYAPPVILQCLAGKSLCFLSTWLESSSEVSSPTIWSTEGNWGPLRGTLLFLAIPGFCISLQPGTVLRWTRFLLCFSYCDGCQDWLANSGKNLWMCVGRMQWKPTGAPCTWEDTHKFRWEMFWLSCLPNWTWRGGKNKSKGEKCKLFAQSTEHKLWYMDAKVYACILLSFLKIA